MRSFWHLEKGDFFDGIEECKEHFLRSAQRIELKKNDIVFLIKFLFMKKIFFLSYQVKLLSNLFTLCK